jgi:hypothetical protein
MSVVERFGILAIASFIIHYSRSPLWAIGLKRELEETEQRRGVSPKMEAAFRRCGCWDGLTWEDEKKEGVTETMGSRNRKVVERQLCGSSEETPEPGRLSRVL